MGICVLALLLATPLVPFGSISTASQLARLDSGDVAPAEFDWQAMRFDFGPSGVAALERMKAEGSPEIRQLATAALAADSRYQVDTPREVQQRAQARSELIVLPAGAQVPEGLSQAILGGTDCTSGWICALLIQPDGRSAVLVNARPCNPDPQSTEPFFCNTPDARAYYLRDGSWTTTRPSQIEQPEPVRRELQNRASAALRARQVEIRTVERRQAFVGNEAVGDVFE